MGMTWQIAEVKKPLASIGRMCDAGNVAIFTKEGGYVVPQKIMNRTMAVLDKLENQSLRVEREGGVYNFKLWIPRPPENNANNSRFSPLQELDEDEADFSWPGTDAM